MKTICVVHFQPVEKYPPTFNFLRTLVQPEQPALNTVVITTGRVAPGADMIIPGISIHRVVRWKAAISKMGRALFYIRFNIKTLFLLLKNRPSAVLYYETLSSGAPWLYKKWVNPACRIFIHYHEYSSPQEYNTGMVLRRWLHKRELSLYKKTAWLSHTNQDRMDLFLSDCGSRAPLNTFIVPNYPPARWIRTNAGNFQYGERTGFVYVGALDAETMYLKEMGAFIAARPDAYYWDIYSDNHSPAAIDFLQQLNAPNIYFKGAVLYDLLPGILPQYQVGVILYKGHIPNYIFNAPNKLFEYAVCGLDVWFPDQMKSSLPYTRSGSYPKIIALDFTSLSDAGITQLTDRNGLEYKPHQFACEEVLVPLIQQLS